MSLDDNTLALLTEVIRYPNTTQAEVAKRRGISRQRINTAVLFACRNFPELSSIFKLLAGTRTIKNNRYGTTPPDHLSKYVTRDMFKAISDK